MKRLTSEQPGSFAATLTQAGVLHGDTVEGELVVGAPPSMQPGTVHLAGCSSYFVPHRTVRKGTLAENKQPIEGEVVFQGGDVLAEAILAQGHASTPNGSWCRIPVTVFTNGHIDFTVSRKVETIPAKATDSLRTSCDQPKARRIAKQPAAYAAA